jgi:hypothetical protein
LIFPPKKARMEERHTKTEVISPKDPKPEMMLVQSKVNHLVLVQVTTLRTWRMVPIATYTK